MSRTVTITPVRKSAVVNVAPTLAFEIFTSGIDTWWPKSHSMGGAPFKISASSRSKADGGTPSARTVPNSASPCSGLGTGPPRRIPLGNHRRLEARRR
jgi:hypothetical protein